MLHIKEKRAGFYNQVEKLEAEAESFYKTWYSNNAAKKSLDFLKFGKIDSYSLEYLLEV